MLRDCFEPTSSPAIDKLLFYVGCCLDCDTPILEALFITSLAEATSYQTIETIQEAMSALIREIYGQFGPVGLWLKREKSSLTFTLSRLDYRKLQFLCVGPLLYSLGSVTYEKVKYGEIERLLESFLAQTQ